MLSVIAPLVLALALSGLWLHVALRRRRAALEDGQTALAAIDAVSAWFAAITIVGAVVLLIAIGRPA